MMLNTREHGYYDAIRGYKSICDRPAAYHEGYEAGTRARIRERRLIHVVTLACLVVATSGLVLSMAVHL